MTAVCMLTESMHASHTKAIPHQDGETLTFLLCVQVRQTGHESGTYPVLTPEGKQKGTLRLTLTYTAASPGHIQVRRIDTHGFHGFQSTCMTTYRHSLSRHTANKSLPRAQRQLCTCELYLLSRLKL